MEVRNDAEITQLCINTIRALSADQPQAAKSGHPGAPMGLAPVAHVLWTRFMKYSPSNPKWYNRDRFVLSNGHACALLYTMLHLTGYNLTIDDLKAFRQVESKTPGHPEANHTDGVEVTTGPLGQGVANAVGLAIAQAHMAARFNKPDFELFNNYTYVICGDGCLQEGISSEASSLAGHLGLGRLILIYDDNKITIDGSTDLSFTEDVGKRYEAYGWHVQSVDHGNSDIDAIARAIEEAQKVTDRPSLIKVRTTIGFGSAKEGKHEVHGAPLGDEDLGNVKRKLGLDPEKKFYVPDEVRNAYAPLKSRGERLESEWQDLLRRYAEAGHGDLAAELKRRMEGQLADGWDADLPAPGADKPPAATRKLSQAVLNRLAVKLPELIGGSADLNPSTLTYLECSVDFQRDTPQGRNIRFGVREHGMAAICNGLAAYGGIVPYCSTFLNFIGYALGAVTLSAITRVQVLYIMTHDSIGLGEDGPTHQPVEKFLVCRCTPNLLFVRPCDGNETAGAYIAALNKRDGPSVLALSRQNLKMQQNTSIEGTLKGAYVIRDPQEGAPELILVGTGSEVQLCTEAAERIPAKVRVVSMPAWELFEQQSKEYQQSVFLPGVPVISVEAGTTKGWSRYSHGQIGVDRFGYSGPYEAVYAKLGITVENIVEKAGRMLAFYQRNPVPVLLQNPFQD